MKVGILTFHRAQNYGAVLQCYALQEYCKRKGHHVYVLDYQNRYLLNCYKIFDRHRFFDKHQDFNKNIIRFKSEIALLKKRILRKQAFESFLGSKINIKQFDEDILNDLDLIIIGSDQVWNIQLTKGFDVYYWGNFIRNSKSRLISYAASGLNLNTIVDKEEKVVKLLRNFDAISIREQSLKNILQEKSAIHINVCSDPTLLVDINIWCSIAKTPSIKVPYVFLYQVRHVDNCLQMSKRIADKMGLRLIVLSANIADNNSELCYAASPEDFLGWIQNASFVISTSFHGTVFSVLFKKQFLTLKLNDNKDDRVENFLNSVGLESRLVENLDNEFDSIDYTNINISNSDIIKYSKYYLNTYL